MVQDNALDKVFKEMSKEDRARLTLMTFGMPPHNANDVLLLERVEAARNQMIKQQTIEFKEQLGSAIKLKEHRRRNEDA